MDSISFIKSFKQYQFLENLNSVGSVQKVYDLVRKEVVVLKVTKITENSHMIHQLEILKNLKSKDEMFAFPRIYDVETHRSLLLYSMEFLEGKSLKYFLENDLLSFVQIIKYFHQTVQTLQKIHSHDIIHGNIKPSNILVNKQNSAAVFLGFGKSVLPGSTTQLFNPLAILEEAAYLAPESNNNEGQKSDVYSLVAVICELLTKDSENLSVDSILSCMAGNTISEGVSNRDLAQGIFEICMGGLEQNVCDRLDLSQIQTKLAIMINLMEDSPQENLSGNLSQINLPNLLQLLASENKTGKLSLKNKTGNFDIFLQEGLIVHCNGLENEGIDALHEVLYWQTGNFEFIPEVTTPITSIQGAVDGLLLEWARCNDENSEDKDENSED